MLKEHIDAILVSKPESFDVFLDALKEKGYEVRSDKNPAAKGNGQNRFIRFRSLGKGYTEDDIRKRIIGEPKFDPEERKSVLGEKVEVSALLI